MCILNPIVKGVLIVVFLVVSIISVLFATQLTTGFNLMELCPDVSYLRDYYEVQESIFGEGEQGVAGIYFKDIKYDSVEVQAQIDLTTSALKRMEWIEPEYGVYSWHESFTEWASTHPTYKDKMTIANLNGRKYLGGALFKPALTEFLEVQNNKRWIPDLAYDEDGNMIASLITAFHRQIVTSTDKAKCLTDMENFCESQPFTTKPIPFSPFYIVWDEFRVIVQETMQTFALVIVAVVFICTIALVHPSSAVLMLVLTVMIDLNIVAAVHFWGFTVNPLTTVCMIISVGLVVDYTVHIVHNYGLQDQTLPRNERVRATLNEMGPSVLLGALSTFLGVMPLALAQSSLFRTFFKMFVAIVLSGVAHGLVLCPVLLSMCGPSIPPRDEDEKKTEKIAGQVEFDHSQWFLYLKLKRRPEGDFGVRFKSVTKDGGQGNQHVFVSGTTHPESIAQEGDVVVSVNSQEISSLEELHCAVSGKQNVEISLQRRRFKLEEVTRLRTLVQIFGLRQTSSQKYNFQLAEVVKEVESGWITVMILEPSLDRKLLLISPFNLVPYIAQSDSQIVSIANKNY